MKKKNGVKDRLYDFGQCILRRVRKIIIKQRGSRIMEDSWFAKCWAEKDELEVYAPINGVIESANEVLSDMPFLFNLDPYKNGWIVEVNPDGLIRTYGASEAKNLLLNDI